MNTYIAGTTIRIEVEIKDVNGDYVDPDSVPKITISIGTTIVKNAQDMTQINDDDGRYYYDWQSTVNDIEGNYDIQITAVKSSKTSIARDERAFYLKT